MENKIVMLKLVDLFPHPDNPRKNIGDITELAESIKHSGVMQNLTVVPYEGKYRVVIGHRRRAAAISAGLEEVPCVISDMDYKTQVATMLCENMQRVDLTITEQTSGIQMMLNLGEDVSSISKKTGFSESTVRRRIKIGALPADELKRAEDRGGTLEEYIKCCEIKDEEERIKVLNAVGTNDFKWKYDSALREQTAKEKTPLLEKAMEKVGAKKIKSEDRWKSEYDSYTNIRIDTFEDNEVFYKKFDSTTEYAWCIIGEYAYFYIISKKAKNTQKKSRKEVEADRRRKEFQELSRKAYNFRKAFILEFSNYGRYKEIIDKWTVYFIATDIIRRHQKDIRIINAAMGREVNYISPNIDDLISWAENPGAKAVLAYYLTGDGTSNSTYSYSWGENYPQYQENFGLRKLYEFLSEIGYQISTEEQELLDGTHELFNKKGRQK